MDPIEMTSILSDEAAVTAFPSAVETPAPSAYFDLSPSFSAGEELEMQQLSGTSEVPGAIVDLSDAAQSAAPPPEEQPWDPTADPANPQYASGANATEDWATDSANPEFWPTSDAA